jgi:phosphoglycolate phosphatase
MSIINIFFDLDGTLIDSRKRLYHLFQELVPTSSFSFEEYWKLKRQRINQTKLLSEWFKYSNDQIKEFKDNWLSKVEEDDRLSLDTPFPSTLESLEKFAKNNNLYIVTNRQFINRTKSQIKKFGWDEYLKEVLITEQKQTKVQLVKENVCFSSNDIFIGDTGEDILAGKELGLKTIAVLSGFLNKEILEEYLPDRILNDVTELIV